MGLPSLKDNYKAAQIRTLMPVMPVIVRQTFTEFTKQNNIHSQWVRFSIDIWSALVKQLNIQEVIHILMWPLHNLAFKLAVKDRDFIQWGRQESQHCACWLIIRNLWKRGVALFDRFSSGIFNSDTILIRTSQDSYQEMHQESHKCPSGSVIPNCSERSLVNYTGTSLFMLDIL